MTIRTLLPENERDNWGFVYIPDEKAVYFMSKQDSSEAAVELFKVSIEGGEPEKVLDEVEFDTEYYVRFNWLNIKDLAVLGLNRD